MQNALQVQFNYEVFKAAYDADEGLASLIANFDKDHIEFGSGKDLPTADAKGDNTVANMAKSATTANTAT